MNIPDVPVATNVEGPSYVSVQPAIQKERGNTLPAVRISLFFFFFDFVRSIAIIFVLWEPSLRSY